MTLRSLIFVVAFGLLVSSPARAQLVITPTDVLFNQDDHNATIDGAAVVTDYILELWTPGQDTSNGGSMNVSPPIPKSAVTTSTVANYMWDIPLSAIAGWQIPKGPTWVATLVTRGPGGTMRSGISNPFTYPLPMRPPHAATGLAVVAKK